MKARCHPRDGINSFPFLGGLSAPPAGNRSRLAARDLVS